MSAAISYNAANFDPRRLMIQMFDAAVESVGAERTLPPHIPQPPEGRTLVLGAGKAAAAMAQVLEKRWPANESRFGGLVVTRYGHGVPTRRIEVVQASHPEPDTNGQIAAGRMLERAAELKKEDLLICLMSGGASSLTSCPPEGVTMEDVRAVAGQLLKCGAPIGEMNVVRKHLSRFSGGRLAAAAFPAKTVSLIISDVPGDDPSIIGSGPTAGDPSTCADAKAILRKYGIRVPPAVERLLDEARDKTIKPSDKRLIEVRNIIIANPQHALAAAAAAARKAGFTPLILGDRCEGEAKDAAQFAAGLPLYQADHADPGLPPLAIISGGETTVTVRNKDSGNGGRNAEFALASALAFAGHPRIWHAAFDTDGLDGTMDNAGAIVTPDTLRRAMDKGLNPARYLERHDSYGFFKALGDLHITGPTRTNVNDLRVTLVL